MTYRLDISSRRLRLTAHQDRFRASYDLFKRSPFNTEKEGGHPRCHSLALSGHGQLGWTFTTCVVLDSKVLTGDAKQMLIAPGMAVQVEVQTGERRLIESLLTPILKGFRESARER